jgi:hypothetical protein
VKKGFFDKVSSAVNEARKGSHKVGMPSGRVKKISVSCRLPCHAYKWCHVKIKKINLIVF